MIFIAMPTMHDTEAGPTMHDALAKADNPQEIVFGVRELTSNPEASLEKYQYYFGGAFRYIKETINYENHLDVIGVGRARNVVASLYDGEEYVLSIDSHTLFSSGWDTTLKTLYHKAVEETGNEYSIITAYPAKYAYVDDNREFLNTKNLYPYMGYDLEVDLESHKFLTRPFYKVSPPWMCKPNVNTDKELIPATKFAFNFSFSGKMFLGNEDTDLVMMEEDMCKTLRLLDNNWDLVFPNFTIPILGHMYVSEITADGGDRASWTHFVSPDEKNMLEAREAENMWKYIEKYKDTAKKYEDWIQCRFNSEDKHNMYIPKTWWTHVGR